MYNKNKVKATTLDSDSDEKSSDLSSQEFGVSDDEDYKKDITHEGYLLRLTSTKKVKKYYCKLVNKDLYCKLSAINISRLQE